MLTGHVREFLRRTLVAPVVMMALAALSGCGVGVVRVATNGTAAEEGTETVAAVRIHGSVHGGAYPIQGATVVLMETQSNGVWTSSSSNYVGTAKPLYVTTSDSRGSFTFPDTGWTCDAGQYVYIEVTGGHTLSTSNANVVQVGVVGDCASDLGSKAAIDGVNVFLSEPSTVAAAYALHSFLSIHNGNLTGVASDGTATLSTTIPLVDLTAAANNNAVPASPSLNPNPTATGAVQVSLASAYNATGIVTDGTVFTGGGFDRDGNAFSSQLVGTSLTYAGTPYTLGAANQANVVNANGGPVIALPSGNFNAIKILAAGVNGAQATQTFTVTYTDGTTTNFTQSLSDWYTALTQNNTGESIALTTSYRDTNTGGQDARQFSIYQYSFAVNRAKLVKSLTLPSNNNVVVLAVTATSNLPSCSGIRAGTALACTAAGLAHGFQNAYNLVDQVTFSASQFPSGVARTSLPGNSQAIAPREMVNTLGNILQECVDSTGGTVTPSYSKYVIGTSRCGDLFYYTTPSGGTSPTNTLQAAINIATYPSANVSQLIQLKPRNVFFTPEIPQANSSQPFAFTMSIFYKGTSLGDTFASPADLALDVQDNVYVAYGGTAHGASAGVVDELTAAGAAMFSTTMSGVANPKSVAVDVNGFAWVSDDSASGGVTGLYTSVNASSTNAIGSGYKAIAVNKGLAAGIAFDASSNLFVTRDSADTNATALLYTASSSYGSGATYSLGYPFQRAAVNAQGNFYAVGSNNATSAWLNYNYGSCTKPLAPTVSTVSSKAGVSMAINNSASTNGSMNAFVPSSGQMSTFLGGSCTSTSNATAAGSQGSLSSSSPAGAAMDGNLSVFWTDAASGLVYSMPSVGASTSISSAAVTSFAPCWYTGGACAAASTAVYQGMAIDSSGAMWFLSQGGSYGLVQMLGMAAPTWPLLASENSGVVVQ